MKEQERNNPSKTNTTIFMCPAFLLPAIIAKWQNSSEMRLELSSSLTKKQWKAPGSHLCELELLSIDITKPLLQFMFIEGPNSQKIQVVIGYERLPNFCYFCGLLGHLLKDCHDCLDIPGNEIQFGMINYRMEIGWGLPWSRITGLSKGACFVSYRPHLRPNHQSHNARTCFVWLTNRNPVTFYYWFSWPSYDPIKPSHSNPFNHYPCTQYLAQ